MSRPDLRPSRSILAIATLLCASLALACGDDAVAPTDPGGLVAAAPPGGFPTVQVRPNVPAQARGAVTNNLADAVARVAAGGTIVVHAGTYVTHDVPIDKPVTIEGRDDPLIVNQSGSASLVIGGVGSGAVTIRGIAFRDDVGTHASGPAGSIALESDFDHVVLDGNTFTGVVGETRSIRQRAVTGAGAPTLTVQDNTFERGSRALSIFNFGGPDVIVSLTGNDVRDFTDRTFFLTAVSGTVADNDFTRCGLNCVFPQAVGSLTVEGNRFDACTANAAVLGLGTGCIFFRFADLGIVRGNHLSDRTTGTGEHFPILVLNVSGFPTAGEYLIEDNVLDGCGEGHCIVTDGTTVATVRGNHLTAYPADGTVSGIRSAALSGPGDDVIEDNFVTGSLEGITVNGGGAVAVVSRNTVSDVHFGLGVLNGAVVTAGIDNVFSNVGHAVALTTGPSGTGSATVNQSDFTNVHVSPVFFDDPGAIADLTCNWWGSAGGPDLTGIPAGIELVPFAESPIAGTGTTTCSGGLP